MALVDAALEIAGPVDAIVYAGDDTARFAQPPLQEVLEHEVKPGMADTESRLVPDPGADFRFIRWGRAGGVALRLATKGKSAAIAGLARLVKNSQKKGHAHTGGFDVDDEFLLGMLIERHGGPKGLLRRARDSFHFHEAGPVAVFLEAVEPLNHFERLAARTARGLGAVLGNDCYPTDRMALRGTGVRDLHRQPWMLGRHGVIGLEGVPECGVGLIKYSEQQAMRHLEASAGQFEARTPLVVVSHAPPYGVLDYSVRFGHSHVGSRALERFVRTARPRLVVCGHSHLSGGATAELNGCVVVNAANHDSTDSLGRFALIDLRNNTTVQWIVPQRDSVRALHGCGPFWEERLRRAGYAHHREFLTSIPEELHASTGAPLGTSRRWIRHAQAMATGRFVQVRSRTETFPSECIFYDLETLPFGGEVDARQIWLIGYRVGRRGPVRQLLAKTPKEERAILRAFMKVLRAHRGMPVACWAGASDFDHNYLRDRLCTIAPSAVRAFDSHPRLNVLTFIRRHAMPPSPSFGLNELARGLGLTGGNGIDGFTAAVAYVDWLQEGTQPDWKGLLDYNAQDVDLMTRTLDIFERTIPMDQRPESVRPILMPAAEGCPLRGRTRRDSVL